MTPIDPIRITVHPTRQLLQLLLHQRPLLEGVIHPLPDIRIQVLVVQRAQRNLPVDPARLRGPDDAPGHDDADVPDAADVRVEPAVGALLAGEGEGEGGGGGVDHVLGDVHGLGQDGAEADAREDVHVVALARGEQAAVVVGEGGEGRARGEEAPPVGVLDGVGEGALGFRGGV